MTDVAERPHARSESERPHCARCGLSMWPIPQQSGEERCDRCREPVEIHLFPAYHTGPSVSRASTLVDTSEASCFHHPDKRAEAVCEGCGRFLCGHCACDWNGASFCLTCLHNLRESGDKRLVNRVFHKDSMALSLAFWPPVSIIGLYFTFFTAPAALFLAIAALRKPVPGLLPRTRARALIALGLSLLQMLGWVLLIVGIIVSV